MLYATRSIEVIRMIEVFRDIGTPVFRELNKAGVPEDLENHLNSYVATVPAGEWSLNCLAIEGVDDFGWLAHKAPDQRRLNGYGISEINHVATLKQQLEVLLRSMRAESNYHSNGIHYGANEIRVIFPNPKNISDMERRISEWSRALDVIHLVRNAVGNNWSPRSIGFTAPGLPCDEAQEHFGNTRFYGNEPATWLTIPNHLLGVPAKEMKIARNESFDSDGNQPDIRSSAFIAPLRAILKTYFTSGRPPIALAANIAGLSTRTLQRRLSASGLTYSELLDQCAFELAREFLTREDTSITDVSLALGYDDPSHFTRSFKRVSGLTPSQFQIAHRS